jgi:hypothetical protein
MLDVSTIIADFAAKNWYGAILVLALYLRTLFSDKSAFPVTLSPNARPIFVALAGALVSTVTTLQAGKSWGTSLLVGAIGLISGGFLDGLLAALFGGATSAPGWARALVALVDQVGGVQAKAPMQPNAPIDPDATTKP